MTLVELYAAMGGDYGQACKVLRIEKLIDKHIRKFPDNDIFSGLVEGGKTMDGEKLFESSHAIKGVCANLGLTPIASLASEICEEFRPGKERKRSDPEVRSMIDEIMRLRALAIEAIKTYSK